MDTNCIFCRIIRGEIPVSKLYEDSQVIAILDINPIRPGHTLLIPKKHYASLSELTPAEQVTWLQPLDKLSRAIVRGTGSEGFNLLLNNGRCAGQVVPHLHIHIIPRKNDDEVSFHWNPRPYPPGLIEKTLNQISNHLVR
ncbi:MAG: HIT family protein [Planctomycetota bacterium]